MEDKKMIELCERLRRELHGMVDQKIEEVLTCLGEREMELNEEVELPLTSLPACFKGKKPISIIYPDGVEIHATNWKRVVFYLLKNCAEDEDMRRRLMIIIGRVYGRSRILLADKGDTMDIPIEFYPNMFVEAKFDTEAMIRVITKRIFKQIGYDYSGIRLKIIDAI